MNSNFDQYDVRDVSSNVTNAKFAVRGVVVIKAEQIKAELESGTSKYPFKDIAFCNIGNPQNFGQTPLTVNREVISGIMNPDLVLSGKLNDPDVCERVKFYLSKIDGNVGAYTSSRGFNFALDSVCKYIAQRDGVTRPKSENIMLTNGASDGIQIALQTLICNNRDGIMIPVPQYPLYSSSISLYGGSEIHFYLNEEKDWSISTEELQRSYDDAISKNIRPKCIVIINPGNPTGSVYNAEQLSEIIRFAFQKRLIIFADEVYQSNIYNQEKKFISFNKLILNMQEPYNKCQLISFHSASKGQLGECGLRGGYMHFTNIDDKVRDEMIKLKSICLCSNTVGQISTDLMINPINSKRHKDELEVLFQSQKQRAYLVQKILNSMVNVKCNPVDGAMYAFALIKFSNNFLLYAKERKMYPDELYCLQVLENTGVVLVPGSGFGQKPGTWHFRTTILILPTERLESKMNSLKNFNEQFHKQYDDNKSKL